MMDIVIKPFFSVWIQCASLSFCLAGQFSDLLIIRLCLTSAYVFTFINGLMGGPIWPHLRLPGHIQLDQFLWSVLNLYVHVSTVVRLLDDERGVTSLRNDEKKLALWRMFFRTGGLSQKVFEKTISRHCDVVTYNLDDVLDTEKYFYIIYQGTVKMTVKDSETNEVLLSRYLQSGQLFDFRALGLLIDYSNVLSKHMLHVVTISKHCIVFRFMRDQMVDIVKNPNTKLLWKEILMETMLRIVQTHFDKRLHNRLIRNEGYIHHIFHELDPDEVPNPYRAGSTEALKNPFYHIYQYMIWSFAPPWPFQGPPCGLRHSQLLVGTGTGRRSRYSRKQKQQELPMTTTETTTLLSTESTTSSTYQTTSLAPSSSSQYDDNHDDDNVFDEYLPSLDEQAAWGMYGIGFIPATGVRRNSTGIIISSSPSHSFRHDSSNNLNLMATNTTVSTTTTTTASSSSGVLT